MTPFEPKRGQVIVELLHRHYGSEVRVDGEIVAQGVDQEMTLNYRKCVAFFLEHAETVRASVWSEPEYLTGLFQGEELRLRTPQVRT